VLPSTDTLVTYPAGALESTGAVLHVAELGDGRLGVVLDVTACHPVDSAWPDQPADRAVLRVDGSEFDVIDCVVGATDGASLYLGSDIPVRKGTEGWAFVAVHVVEAGAAIAEGATATVAVDAVYRAALSIGHTACHLASLALNAELAAAWTKDVPVDSHGNPNFDALAIDSSLIHENGSVDVYRLGKSLRKKGFTPATLTDDLEGIATAVTARLAAWVATDAPAAIEVEGQALTDRRYWRTELDGVAISIPCGGTHAASLGGLAGIRSTLEQSDEGSAIEVRMTTEVR